MATVAREKFSSQAAPEVLTALRKIAATDVFLRITGWRIGRAPSDIYRDFMAMFDSGTFDIAHLERWLRRIAKRR